MRKTIKNIFIGALSVLCFAGIGGAMYFNVEAVGETTALPELKYGASIRYNPENSGLRFSATVSDKYFTNGVLNEGVEAGLLMVPTDLLDSEDAFVYGSSDTDVKAVAAEKFTLKSDRYEYNIAIYNIPSKNFGTQIRTKAYVKTDSDVLYSDTETTRSVAETASRCVASHMVGDVVLDEKKLNLLSGYITAQSALQPAVKIDGKNEKLIISGAENAVCYVIKCGDDVRSFDSAEIALSELPQGEASLIAVGDGVSYKNSGVLTVNTVLQEILGEDYAWDAAYSDNGDISAVESTAHVNEGKKSIKLSGIDSGYYGYFLSRNKLALLAAAYDKISFDVYVESSAPVFIWVNNEGKGINCPANEWTTLSVEISQLDTWKAFLLNDTPTAFYFDNFRGGNAQSEIGLGNSFDVSDRVTAIQALGYTVVVSVEDESGNSVTEGISGSVFTPTKAGKYNVKLNISKEGYKDYAFVYPIDVQVYDFYPTDFAWDILTLNRPTSTITEKTDNAYGAIEGNKYAYYTMEEGYDGYTINVAYLTELREMYDAVAFDVYAINGNLSVSRAGWQVDEVSCPAGTWTTVVLPIANIDEFNTKCPVLGAGTFAIDNVRGVNLTQNVTFGTGYSVSERVATLESNGYTVKSVKFYTSAGVEVTEGVDGYTFTPSAAGEYTAKITVSKTGYNDYDMNIDITCS